MFRIASFMDNRLIERVFQPLSNALYLRLGVPRFRAACLSLDAAAIAWTLTQAAPLSNAVLGWQAGLAVMRGSILLLGLTALLSLRSLFRRLSASPRPNPLRAKMLPYRCLVLLFLITDLCHAVSGGSLGADANMAMLGFATMALYLAACDAPKLKRRWSSLASAEAA